MKVFYSDHHDPFEDIKVTNQHKKIIELWKIINDVPEEDIYNLYIKREYSIYSCGTSQSLIECIWEFDLGKGYFSDLQTCLNYIESALINQAKDILRMAKRLKKFNITVKDE